MTAINVYAVVVIIVSTVSTVYSVRLCYSGKDLASPTDANQVVECGQHETCYLEQYVTPSGGVLHKAGCKDTKFCGTGSVADPNIGVCSECCDKDLCAGTLCGNSGLPAGSGPICYECSNALSDPAHCSSIKTCRSDEVCGVNADGNGKYNVQCMAQNVCNGHLSTSTCASCCSTQLCNFNCTQQTPLVTTTPATTTTAPTTPAPTTTAPTTPAPTTPSSTTPAPTTPAPTTTAPTTTASPTTTAPTTASPTTTAPTTASLSMPCKDDDGCAQLYQTFQVAGEDICQKPGLKTFCNKTCSLCPGMTTQPTTATPTTTPPATTHFDACSLGLCANGACSILPTGTFQCTCTSGFVGLLCDQYDPCTVKPCLNGNCVSFHNGTFVCNCDAGHNGVLCEKAFGPCHSNPCTHGTCLDNGNTYQCSCNSGYVGHNCDILNPCEPSPCVHGICSLMTNGSHTCVCPSSYTGVLCERASGPCTNNPCLNGACIEVDSSFVCVCNAGFMGALCDKHDPCQPSPCHHGTCQVTSGTLHCKCYTGFTGSLCDTAIVSCTSAPDICHHGTCQNDGNAVKCSCDRGWTGDNCNMEIRDCKDVADHHLVGHTNSEAAVAMLGGHPTNVLCDMQTESGGWTVLMNRNGNSTNFPDKTYAEYTAGFGELHGDFWAGLAQMHNLTSDGRRYQLRVELQVGNGTVYVANYDDFSIGPQDEFVLHIGTYSGDAGDSLSGHNGFGFTTKELDHDSNSINCGWYLQGAWWFHTCSDSCLTCPYKEPGVSYANNCRVFSWNALGYCVALKSARFLVRPM